MVEYVLISSEFKAICVMVDDVVGVSGSHLLVAPRCYCLLSQFPFLPLLWDVLAVVVGLYFVHASSYSSSRKVSS